MAYPLPKNRETGFSQAAIAAHGQAQGVFMQGTQRVTAQWRWILPLCVCMVLFAAGYCYAFPSDAQQAILHKRIDRIVSSKHKIFPKEFAQLEPLVSSGLKRWPDDAALRELRMQLRIVQEDFSGARDDLMHLADTAEQQMLVCMLDDKLGQTPQELRQCYAKVALRMQDSLKHSQGGTAENSNTGLKNTYMFARFMALDPQEQSLIVPPDSRDYVRDTFIQHLAMGFADNNFWGDMRRKVFYKKISQAFLDEKAAFADVSQQLEPLLNEGLKQWPDDQALRWLRIWLRFVQQEYSGAREDLRLTPANTNTHMLLCMLDETLGQPKQDVLQCYSEVALQLKAQMRGAPVTNPDNPGAVLARKYMFALLLAEDPQGQAMFAARPPEVAKAYLLENSDAFDRKKYIDGVFTSVFKGRAGHKLWSDEQKDAQHAAIGEILRDKSLVFPKNYAMLKLLFDEGLQRWPADVYFRRLRIQSRIEQADLTGARDDLLHLQNFLEERAFLCILNEKIGQKSQETFQCYADLALSMRQQVAEATNKTSKALGQDFENAYLLLMVATDDPQVKEILAEIQQQTAVAGTFVGKFFKTVAPTGKRQQYLQELLNMYF